MKLLGFCSILVVAFLVLGCDKKGGSTKAPPPPDASAAKAVLDEMAASGQMGSGIQTVLDYADNLKKTDAAKGESLAKEVEALSKLESSPAALKAKAKEISGKL